MSQNGARAVRSTREFQDDIGFLLPLAPSFSLTQFFALSVRVCLADVIAGDQA